MNKSLLYQLSLFAIPIACIGLASGLNVYEMRRMEKLGTKLKATETEITEARQLIAGVEKRGKAGFIALVPDTPQEQIDFVSSLRSTAAQCHVSLTRWGTAAAVTITAADGTSQRLKDDLAKVTPITNEITVAGSYDQVRAFLYSLTQQERLVTLAGVRWERAAIPPQTTLNLRLTRYVGFLNAATPPPVSQ
ncbi:MAG: hypothetical protein JWL77_998 [Chthonomonadaceae bacterium]|nr:hypothetical protein [Chthonomonadaceae bacterium]